MVMSVSAIEILQSSPSSGEDKKAEERQGPSGLFAMLLQQSSMQHVAYAGLINEFNLALTLHGQAAGSHPDSAPPPEQPLASTQEAVPPDDRHDDAIQHAQPPLAAGKADGDAAAPRPADAHRHAPTPANGAAGNDGAPKQQSLGDVAKLAAQAGSLPAQAHAQARAGGIANTNAHGSIAATVTQAPATTVAQPAGSLAAGAAATVQAAQDARSVNQSAKSAEDSNPTDTSIIQSTLSRAPGKVQAAARQGQSPPTPPAQGQSASPDTAGNQNGVATAALMAPRTLVAASAAQGEQPAGQAARSFGETLFGSPGSTLAGSTQRSAALPTPPKSARPNLPPRLIADQIAVNIQKAVGQGLDRIQIQLKPAELGRVDVQIEVGKDGHVGVHISADRQDTLDSLQRDSRVLQQALQDAGLRADANSLSFNLRGDGGAFQRELAGHSPASTDDSSTGIEMKTLAEDDAPRRSRRIDSGHVDVEV